MRKRGGGDDMKIWRKLDNNGRKNEQEKKWESKYTNLYSQQRKTKATSKCQRHSCFLKTYKLTVGYEYDQTVARYYNKQDSLD